MSSQLDAAPLRTIDLLLDDATGLTVLHGLPGSGRSSLVRDWLLRSPARTSLWVDASGSPDDVSAPSRGGIVVVRGLVSRAVKEWLPQIQAWLSAGVDVVVISDGPFALSGWPLSRTVIGPQDLAWDEPQVRACFEARAVEATDEVITRISAETGGWAALVTAAVEAWPIGSVASQPGQGLTAAMTALQSGLLSQPWLAGHAALLEALTLEAQPAVGMIEMLVGVGAGSAIDDLQSFGLVRTVLDSSIPTVAMLPMVRSHLLSGTSADDSQVRREQHRLAGSWYSEARRPAQALEHHVLAEDWPAVLETLDRWSLDLFLQLPTEVVTNAVRCVQKVTSAELPAGLGHLAECLRLLPLGTAPAPAPGALVDERMLKAMLLATIARRRAFRTRDALNISNRMAGLVEGPRAVEIKGILPVWFLNHGLSQTLAVDFPGGRDSLVRAWKLRRQDPFGFVGRAAAALLAAIEAVLGDTAASRTWLARCYEEPLPPPHQADWADAPLSIAEQVLAGDLMDFELAGSYLDVGYEWFDELWPMRVWVQFRDHIQRKDQRTALALIDIVMRRFPGAAESDGLHATGVDAVRAMALLMAGQATKARQYAEKHQDVVLGVNALARIRLFGGDAEGGHRLAVAGVETFNWSPRSVLSLQITASAGALAMGRVDEGGQRLEDAIAIARSRQMVGLMIDVPRELLEAYADRPSVADLLQTLDDIDWKPAFPADAVVVQLTDRERVVLGELASGRSVEQISRNLIVSVNTIKSQIRSLYRKLDARNRGEALAEADRLGLLPPTVLAGRSR